MSLPLHRVEFSRKQKFRRKEQTIVLTVFRKCLTWKEKTGKLFLVLKCHIYKGRT